MTLENLVTTAIAAWDHDFKRVDASNIVHIADLKPGEIMDQIRHQVAKRPKGRYELVCVGYPDFDALVEWLDDSIIDDDRLDLLYKLAAELLGEAPVLWIIPEGHAQYNKDALALLFSDFQ